MERIVHDAIVSCVEDNSLFTDCQHGFRSRRSCLTNLLVTLDNVTGELDAGRSVVLCYFDFAKAFAIVNHRLLLAKLG